TNAAPTAAQDSTGGPAHSRPFGILAVPHAAAATSTNAARTAAEDSTAGSAVSPPGTVRAESEAMPPCREPTEGHSWATPSPTRDASSPPVGLLLSVSAPRAPTRKVPSHAPPHARDVAVVAHPPPELASRTSARSCGCEAANSTQARDPARSRARDDDRSEH